MPKLLRKASAAALKLFMTPSANTGSSESSLNVLPHDRDAPSEGIPQNILAFRTITTLLEIIQQERPFKVIDDERKLSDSDRRELKLSSAFSTVAVANHEVVAIVAKQCPGKLEVMACNYDSTNQQTIEPPQPSSNFTFSFAALFTKNFRRDDLTKIENEDKKRAEEERKRRFPVIKTTEIPPDLVGHGDEGLWKYLEQPRRDPTLATHLYILNRLLVMPGLQHNEESLDPLLRYVIAISYPKMLRRLQHPVSRRYLNSLKAVTGIRFSNHPWELSEPGNDDSNDERFLVWLHKLAVRKPRFLDKFPKIVYQAKLAVEDQPFQLYSKDTCEEFHLLLVKFLESFQSSLTKLSEARGSPTNVPTQDSGFSPHRLHVVYLMGVGLQYLSRTTALQHHLKAFRQDFLAESSEKDGECENLNERDEDLESVQPFITTEDSQGKLVQQIPLRKSYENWLRLLVAHFDAVEILRRHFNRSLQNISLNILVAPVVDNTLLPWKKLLLSPHFPPATPPHAITNDEILRFLEKALSPVSHLIKTAHGEWGKRKSHPSGQLQFDKIRTATKSYIEKWPKDMPSGWSKCRSRLIKMLDSDKLRLGSRSEDFEEQVEMITNMIESLVKSVSVILLMESATTRGFFGTLHCEACIASLLTSHNIRDMQDDEFIKTLAQMKHFGRVIGVSKRCCPTCRYLLELLNSSQSPPFIVKGSHCTVTSCTLPTWLREEIVDSMNEYFGDQLRRELINLIERPESLRSRKHSTGSERLSLDSLEGNFNAGGGDVMDELSDSDGDS